MRDLRFTFIRIIAVILVIGILLFSPLFSLTAKNSAVSTMNVPPQPRYVTTFDRPRPEVRIERVLKLEDLTGFDPDLATLFEATRVPQRSDMASAAETGARNYDEVALVSHEIRGGAVR
jgi:hypothetical protein